MELYYIVAIMHSSVTIQILMCFCFSYMRPSQQNMFGQRGTESRKAVIPPPNIPVMHHGKVSCRIRHFTGDRVVRWCSSYLH